MSMIKSMMKDEATGWFNDLISDDKSVEVEISFTTLRELEDITEQATETTFGKKGRRIEKTNKPLHYKLLAERIVKNWRGLKLKHFPDLGLLLKEGVNLEQEVPYSVEAAADLIEVSDVFDKFVMFHLNEVSDYVAEKREEAVKKSDAMSNTNTQAQKA